MVEVGLLLQEVEGFVDHPSLRSAKIRHWVDGLFAQVEVEPALDTYLSTKQSLSLFLAVGVGITESRHQGVEVGAGVVDIQDVSVNPQFAKELGDPGRPITEANQGVGLAKTRMAEQAMHLGGERRGGG